ncbi:MAG: hypothetical protein V5A50_11640, partial [Thiohalorhabdus sp.]|uniref:hypothetical protein n=1 Tax=Thiohalorhabdus sp. TaxID=3094134 RepID=UPI002FC3CBF6
MLEDPGLDPAFLVGVPSQGPGLLAFLFRLLGLGLAALLARFRGLLNNLTIGNAVPLGQVLGAL